VEEGITTMEEAGEAVATVAAEAAAPVLNPRSPADPTRRVPNDKVGKVPPFGRTVWRSISAISLKRWSRNNDIWLNTVSAV
jgi:hypothetical protein